MNGVFIYFFFFLHCLFVFKNVRNVDKKNMIINARITDTVEPPIHVELGVCSVRKKKKNNLIHFSLW